MMNITHKERRQSRIETKELREAEEEPKSKIYELPYDLKHIAVL